MFPSYRLPVISVLPNACSVIQTSQQKWPLTWESFLFSSGSGEFGGPQVPREWNCIKKAHTNTRSCLCSWNTMQRPRVVIMQQAGVVKERMVHSYLFCLFQVGKTRANRFEYTEREILSLLLLSSYNQLITTNSHIWYLCPVIISCCVKKQVQVTSPENGIQGQCL